MKAETAKAEPGKAESPQAEPAKAESPQAEPAKAELEKAEPAQAEPPKTEPPRAERPKVESAQAEPASKSAGPEGAALPAEEMPFSNSTLHWLDDADQGGGEEDPSHRITVPGYDPTAPVAGRKRAVLVVGGAGALAVLITGLLYVMAPKHTAAPEPSASAEPARALTTRAETALAANKVGEALDLARLALVADPRFADAHFIVGTCDKVRNEVPGAREEFRRYLELAPLGTHAAAAREALAALPP